MQTIKTIRYIIGTDGIRQMEGIEDYDAVISAYRSALETRLATEYPGAEIEVGEEYDSRIEVDAEAGAYAEDAVRSVADGLLIAMLEGEVEGIPAAAISEGHR